MGLLVGPFMGPVQHNLFNVWIVLCFTFYVAAQFQGAGNTFSSTFNMPMNSAIILGAFIIMLYTFMGGFWAVSVTDAIQGALMVGAAILLPLFALVEIGGVGALIDGLGTIDRQGLLSLSGTNID